MEGKAPSGRPFTGAWIETALKRQVGKYRPVAPSRGRGLKLAGRNIVRLGHGSPLHGGVD